jgi:RAB6A-GEF complex partner protein 2
VLEAHESLPHSLAQSTPNASRQMRRIHAEQHLSCLTSAIRTTFSLDIPSDASPAFQITIASEKQIETNYGGLEWKVRLCFLVAVAPPQTRTGADGVRMKALTVDGPKGEWGTTWTSTRTISPLARMTAAVPSNWPSSSSARATQSWTSFLAGAFLGLTEPDAQYHDGDEGIDDEEHELEPEEDWKEMVVEMVECEVPIKVWPGNTAFKATEMVFEV